MKNIIASWICVETNDTSTYFPSVKGNSADVKIQNIYWRCLCCFYTTARHFNPGATLVFFSNISELPTVDKTSVGDLLKRLGVRHYVTPFEYKTPDNYFSFWRNQFYEFSIFKFISTHPDFNDDDKFIMVDSDCIIHADLAPVFNAVEEHGCITYVIDYNPDYKINGNSRKEMKIIFEELSGKPVDKMSNYHAGEFYASLISILKTIVNDFYVVWDQLMKRHYAGLEKLHEEAHVLSYLYYKNGFEGGQANKFVKRLWTDPTKHRNVDKNDGALPIWHLPGQKRFGFKRFFSWLQKRNFDISSIDSNALQNRLKNTFTIPDIPLNKKPYFFVKALARKVLGK